MGARARHSGRRAGHSVLVLAIVLAIGLVSLGIGGVSLARAADRRAALADDPSLLVPAVAPAQTSPAPEAAPEVRLEPTAPARPAARELELRELLERGPLAGYALFAEEALCIAGSARVQGAVGGNGDVWVRDAAGVEGPALPGPHGQVLREREDAVSGRTAARRDPIELRRPPVPTLPLREDLRLAQGERRALEPGRRGYETLALGPDARLELAGPAVLVVRHLHLAAGAELVVDGAVDLHVLEDLRLESGASLRSASGSPDELALHLVADNLRRAGAVIDFTADADARGGLVVGRVYAPSALVTLDGELTLRGSLFAQGVKLDGRALVASAQAGGAR